MDHGGGVARPTTAASAQLGMAGAVQGSEANIGLGTLDSHLGAAAGRGEVPVAVLFHRHLHQEPGRGVAYANTDELWRQRGPVDVAFRGLHLHVPVDGVVPVLDDYGYSALQHRPGAGHGDVLVNLHPDGAGDGEAFVHHVVPGPGGVAYAYPNDIGAASWRHPCPVHVALVGPRLPGGVVPVHGNYGYYSALHPRPGPGARRGVVLGGGGGGGAAHDNYGYYALLPRPDAGLGESFVSFLPGGVGAAHDDYGYYALQPRPDAGRGEVLVGQLPDGAGHGEVFVGLLPGGGGAGHDDYGYYAWQPRPGAGRGEVLPDGVGVVFGGLGDFAQPTLPAPGIRRADGIAGALRYPNLGAGHDGSVALADGLGEGYGNRRMVSEHLRRLLPFAGIGASSVAINGLAAGPGSAAVAFQLFVLLLGGLFLVILHVLRV